jgi:hypothetical protein
MKADGAGAAQAGRRGRHGLKAWEWQRGPRGGEGSEPTVGMEGNGIFLGLPCPWWAGFGGEVRSLRQPYDPARKFRAGSAHELVFAGQQQDVVREIHQDLIERKIGEGNRFLPYWIQVAILAGEGGASL